MLDSYKPGTGVSLLSSVPNQFLVIAMLYYTLLSTKYNVDINLTNNGNGELET